MEINSPIPKDLRWLDGLDNELIVRIVSAESRVRELEQALERATKILKAWADNDIVSDETLMEMTDEVIPLCDAVLATLHVADKAAQK